MFHSIELWRNNKMQSNKMFKTRNAYKFINKIFNKVFNCLLKIVEFLRCFRIFVEFFCFNVRSFERHSTSHRNRMKRSSIKKKENQFIVSKRNWKKTKNNVTSVHWIQHLTKLIFLFYHIEWQSRNSFIIKFSTCVFADFHVFVFHFDILV